jgi:hypothetical protein
MKRIVTILITVAVLLGLAAVPASAYPPPVPGCQVEGVTSVPPPWWFNYASDIDGWRGGSFRVSSGCGRVINYDSWGQQNGEQCSMARINYRYINLTTPWLVACRNSPAVRLHGMAPVNESFYIECRDIHAAHRARSDGFCAFLLHF